MSTQPFSIQLYTPSIDLAVNRNPNVFDSGRVGPDTHVTALPNETLEVQKDSRIDVFLGDLVVEDPFSRLWNDTFILGDWKGSYYANGDPSILGFNNLAVILDFDPSQDSIELYGTSDLYRVQDFLGLGSALIQLAPSGIDVVGFLLGQFNLNLEADYFKYQGFTPPPVALPQQIQQFGTPGFDITPTIRADNFGNIYAAGGSTGSLGGDNAGLRDAVIVQLDEQGQLLRTTQFGSTHFDTIYGITTDIHGNLYITGTTEGDLASAKQAQNADSFIAKYDSQGNQLWIQQFAGNFTVQPEDFISYSIDVDDNGNAYVTGTNFRFSALTDDVFVAKFDTNGNQVWLTDIVTSNFDEAYTIAVDRQDGSVYVGGWTWNFETALAGTATRLIGVPSSQGETAYDATVTKLDNDGVLQWTKILSTPDYDWTVAVDTDTHGNVYATGYTLGSLGGESAGSYDNWLFKFDSEGNQLWSIQFGTSNEEQPFNIFIDNSDNVFLSGYTNGDLGGSNAGSFDAWVARFDTDGNQIWLQQFGSGYLDQALGVTADSESVYVTGATQGSLGNLNQGSFDSWVAKLNKETGILENFNPATLQESLNGNTGSNEPIQYHHSIMYF